MAPRPSLRLVQAPVSPLQLPPPRLLLTAPNKRARVGDATRALSFAVCSFATAWRALARSAPLAHVDEVSGDRRSGGHARRHEMRAPFVALPPLEIAVRGRGATLLRLQLVGIHREAHGAARLAPVEAGLDEDLVEAFRLGLLLHQARARHDHRVDARVD